jgi:L,D-transpeptidase YcbB
LILASFLLMLLPGVGHSACLSGTATPQLLDVSSQLMQADSPRVREALRRLYQAEPGTLLWSVEGRPTSQAAAIVAILENAHDRGLRPGDYDAATRRSELTALTLHPGAPVEARSFDVSLSRSVLRLLEHLHMGRVDPRKLGFDIPESHADLDLAALIIGVSQSPDVSATVAGAEPRYVGYVRLASALKRYRGHAQNPDLRPPPQRSTTLRPGDLYPDAPSLRRLLVAFGDLPPHSPIARDSTGAELYAGAMVEAVKSFQRRHGLSQDAQVGPATMAQLRVPIADRVRQMELTLERWRWLPDHPPSRYIVVNIPAFRLALFEDDPTAGRPELTMNVIVGQAGARRTPIFTNVMREVVFRPYWDVPLNIARNELLPIIRRNPAYMERNAFEIVRGGDEGATIYRPTAANLDLVAAGILRIRQRPGPSNALGLVKFVFPNRYNVYMHDTPTKSLFDQVRRDFSHGCIRLGEPAELAVAVLRGQPEWGAAAIESAMSGTRTQRIRLARPVAVYVLYATAIVDGAGAIMFLPDLYGHDAALARILGASPVR